jgi:hypothetical protein
MGPPSGIGGAPPPGAAGPVPPPVGVVGGPPPYPGATPNQGINALARLIGPTPPRAPGQSKFKPHSDARDKAKTALGMRPPAPLGQGRVGMSRNVSDLFRRLPRLPR